MEVILNKTIDNLGLEGELVNVKPGYARNYLIPQQIAMPINKQNLARLQQQKEAIEARLEKGRKEAGTLADKLSNVTIEVARRVGDEDRLFGSVTTADIAEKLEEKGITIDRRTILLNDPIKSLGDTKVMIKVGYQLNTEITVQVIPETIGD